MKQEGLAAPTKARAALGKPLRATPFASCPAQQHPSINKKADNLFAIKPDKSIYC
jgi:hypothetical protein